MNSRAPGGILASGSKPGSRRASSSSFDDAVLSTTSRLRLAGAAGGCSWPQSALARTGALLDAAALAAAVTEVRCASLTWAGNVLSRDTTAATGDAKCACFLVATGAVLSDLLDDARSIVELDAEGDELAESDRLAALMRACVR